MSYFDKIMLIPIIVFIVTVLGAIISILKQNKLWKWLSFILIISATIFGLTESYFGNEEMNKTIIKSIGDEFRRYKK